MQERVRKILTRIVNLPKVVESYTELLNFKQLSLEEKLVLLNDNYTFYKDFLQLDNLSTRDRLSIIQGGHKKLYDHAVFSDKELDNMSDLNYSTLLHNNFEKYYVKERFSVLGRHYKLRVFYDQPEWYKDNVEEGIPKLTIDMLNQLSYSSPKFIDANPTCFLNISTTAYFWNKMISYNKKYKEIFLMNTNSLMTKTHVRDVVREHPDIIKLLTPDMLQKSKLSSKEWILLVKEIQQRPSNRKLKDWEFSDDMKSILELNLTMEILSGKSKSSKVFQNAMKEILQSGTSVDTD